MSSDDTTDEKRPDPVDHDAGDRDSGERADGKRAEHDPRLGTVSGDEGFPGPLVDTDRNMPGDQPLDSRGPNKSELEGKN